MASRGPAAWRTRSGAPAPQDRHYPACCFIQVLIAELIVPKSTSIVRRPLIGPGRGSR
jgi:hypothetical protein